MTRALRVYSLPTQGYGDKPQTAAEVLTTAAARIQSTLPGGWAVQVSSEVDWPETSTNPRRDPDTRLSLVRGKKTVATYLVEVKRAVASNSLPPTIDELLNRKWTGENRTDSPRPMLVARYLNTQQQRRLRERGIAYADATGNLNLTFDDPLILLSDRGATADPWRGPGRPTTGLTGLPAAKLVRALTDFTPPYSVAKIADLAGASLGAAYRLADYLSGEGLLTRAERGPITEVQWPDLLRRWGEEARYLETSTTSGFLEPRGVDGLVTKLGKKTQLPQYAVSGSLAAQPYAPYAEARLGLIYTEDPAMLASDLGLRPVESGANILLARPRSSVVFERNTTWREVTVVAPSQAAADLLGGPGRNPAEGDFLLTWMKENEDAWRKQPDR